VALANAGFSNIKSVEPGTMILIDKGRMGIERYAPVQKPARCFFEWVYFANAGSTIDSCGVYVCRANLGVALAKIETEPIDPEDCVVVPVPDTAKPAADALAHELGLPCVEGLLRNRYVGRTFIEGSSRQDRARRKYTPVPEVMQGKRVFLVEDSIVRATTLNVLAEQIKTRGRAREIHLRVSCPPILSPCFYGIDMSTVSELFAPTYLPRCYRGEIPEKFTRKMAHAVHADSLKYLPLSALAECIGMPEDQLCLACLNHHYPTPAGERLYRRALRRARNNDHRRAYE
jgi:amidophosphoribosyltransferase